MSPRGPMTLYIVRHGAAEPGSADRTRRLSPEGIAEIQALADLLRLREVSVDRILHSGFRRAEETAEILGNATGAPVRRHQGLAPEDDPDALVAELPLMKGATLIVGHMPFLGSLCRQLIGERIALPELRTSSVVCLEPLDATLERRSWRIAWHGSGRG
jgi:phosphohistidine phosphatase